MLTIRGRQQGVFCDGCRGVVFSVSVRLDWGVDLVAFHWQLVWQKTPMRPVENRRIQLSWCTCRVA